MCLRAESENIFFRPHLTSNERLLTTTFYGTLTTNKEYRYQHQHIPTNNKPRWEVSGNREDTRTRTRTRNFEGCSFVTCPRTACIADTQDSKSFNTQPSTLALPRLPTPSEASSWESLEQSAQRWEPLCRASFLCEWFSTAQGGRLVQHTD